MIDHTKYWTCSARCVDGRVGVTQMFRIESVVVRSYGAAHPRNILTADRGSSSRVIESRDERLGFPKCEKCGAPALWVRGETMPVRRVDNLTAEVQYSHAPADPFVQFFGAYPTKELADELIAAGWKRPDWYSEDLRMPASYDLTHIETDTFDLPQPTDHKGRAVRRVECAKEIEALFAICESWGIPLAGPRKRTLAESM